MNKFGRIPENLRGTTPASSRTESGPDLVELKRTLEEFKYCFSERFQEEELSIEAFESAVQNMLSCEALLSTEVANERMSGEILDALATGLSDHFPLINLADPNANDHEADMNLERANKIHGLFEEMAERVYMKRWESAHDTILQDLHNDSDDIFIITRLVSRAKERQLIKGVVKELLRRHKEIGKELTQGIHREGRSVSPAAKLMREVILSSEAEDRKILINSLFEALASVKSPDRWHIILNLFSNGPENSSKILPIVTRILDECGLDSGLRDTLTRSWEGPKRLIQNTRKVIDLESVHPGSTLALHRYFNIVFFHRYPTTLLIKQYLLKDDQRVNYGVIAVAQEDHSNAFDDFGKNWIATLIEKIGGANMTIRIVELAQSSDILRAVIALQRLYPDKKIAFGIIAAHGAPQNMIFGTSEASGNLTSDRIKQSRITQERISSLFAPEASLVLDSCSTGSPEGIANALSEKTGLRVSAPLKDASLQSLTVSITGAGTEQISVSLTPSYSKNVSTTVYDGWKTPDANQQTYFGIKKPLESKPRYPDFSRRESTLHKINPDKAPFNGAETEETLADQLASKEHEIENALASLGFDRLILERLKRFTERLGLPSHAHVGFLGSGATPLQLLLALQGHTVEIAEKSEKTRKKISGQMQSLGLNDSIVLRDGDNADITKMKLAEDSFDIIFALNILDLVDEREEVYIKILKAVKHEGLIAIGHFETTIGTKEQLNLAHHAERLGYGAEDLRLVADEGHAETDDWFSGDSTTMRIHKRDIPQAARGKEVNTENIADIIKLFATLG